VELLNLRRAVQWGFWLKNDATDTHHSGLIAVDMASAYPELVISARIRPDRRKLAIRSLRQCR
jgi:hypothetical protein